MGRLTQKWIFGNLHHIFKLSNLLNQNQINFTIIKLSKMKNIKKLQNQIKALNFKLLQGNVKNVYAVKGKINELKGKLQQEIDRYNWEAFESL